MYINADTIIKAASLLGAIGALVAAIVSVYKVIESNKKQGEFINAIQEEQTLICYGLRGALQTPQLLIATQRQSEQRAELALEMPGRTVGQGRRANRFPPAQGRAYRPSGWHWPRHCARRFPAPGWCARAACTACRFPPVWAALHGAA